MAEAAGNSLRILVADDNQNAADSLAVLLRLWGYGVEVAYDGVAALQTARQFLPDVALLDFQMPGLNGGEVARRLKTIPEHEGIVVIATTGTEFEEICLAGYGGAFDAYVAKPYNLDRLEQLVEDWQTSCFIQRLNTGGRNERWTCVPRSDAGRATGSSPHL